MSLWVSLSEFFMKLRGWTWQQYWKIEFSKEVANIVSRVICVCVRGVLYKILYGEVLPPALLYTIFGRKGNTFKFLSYKMLSLLTYLQYALADPQKMCYWNLKFLPKKRCTRKYLFLKRYPYKSLISNSNLKGLRTSSSLKYLCRILWKGSFRYYIKKLTRTSFWCLCFTLWNGMRQRSFETEVTMKRCYKDTKRRRSKISLK